MITVLYVDDELDILDLVKSHMEDSGEFSVEIRSSVQDALNALDSRHYDAIVSDYQIPGMDGIGFLKSVREKHGDIPSIIFTGRGREQVAIEALNNGADFYLQKGRDLETQFVELMHVVKRSVVQKQLEKTLLQQEQRYHDLQNANDLIQSVAPDGHFLYVNKKWMETLGYKEDDIPNLGIFDIIHDESLAHCMDTFQRVISGENVGIIDAVFKTRDGKR
ncbi:MAG TPA: response regulator, partial [Methanoregulaceae archaeon]|nr:response regulator [Methanoregulaceae archaeon]